MSLFLSQPFGSPSLPAVATPWPPAFAPNAAPVAVRFGTGPGRTRGRRRRRRSGEHLRIYGNLKTREVLIGFWWIWIFAFLFFGFEMIEYDRHLWVLTRFWQLGWFFDGSYIWRSYAYGRPPFEHSKKQLNWNQAHPLKENTLKRPNYFKNLRLFGPFWNRTLTTMHNLLAQLKINQTKPNLEHPTAHCHGTGGRFCRPAYQRDPCSKTWNSSHCAGQKGFWHPETAAVRNGHGVDTKHMKKRLKRGPLQTLDKIRLEILNHFCWTMFFPEKQTEMGPHPDYLAFFFAWDYWAACEEHQLFIFLMPRIWSKNTVPNFMNIITRGICYPHVLGNTAPPNR